MSKVSILNVSFDNITQAQVLERTETFIKSTDSHYIVTANPEFVVRAQREGLFRRIVNEANVR